MYSPPIRNVLDVAPTHHVKHRLAALHGLQSALLLSLYDTIPSVLNAPYT